MIRLRCDPSAETVSVEERTLSPDRAERARAQLPLPTQLQDSPATAEAEALVAVQVGD